MKFRTLSALAAAAMALSVSVSARAQVASLPSFGLQTLGLSSGLLALPTASSLGGLTTIPGNPTAVILPLLSLNTLTSLLGGTSTTSPVSGFPVALPGLSLLSLDTLTGLLGSAGGASLPGVPTSISGLPSLPSSSDLGNLNGYLVYLTQDLNGIPVPTRLNLLAGNSPIAFPVSAPAFPTNLGAQYLANAGLPLVSDLVGTLLVLNRTSVPLSASALPISTLPIPGI